jgi:hypothetical protein
MKSINTLSGENSVFFILKQLVQVVTIVLWSVNPEWFLYGKASVGNEMVVQWVLTCHNCAHKNAVHEGKIGIADKTINYNWQERERE